MKSPCSKELTLHPAALTNCIQPCIGLVQGTAYSGVLGQDDTDVGALLVTRMCHPDGQLLAGVRDAGREFRPTSGGLLRIRLVSAIPIPLSSQKCLGQLQSLLARENLRPQPPAREIIPIEISGWPVVRESHLEDPAHGRARKVPATRADAGGDSIESTARAILTIGWRGCTSTAIFQMGCWTIRQETHQAVGSRACEKRRTAKMLQLQNLDPRSTSGFKGVSWHKKRNEYCARIGFSRKAN
jgi:hypothetical protein